MLCGTSRNTLHGGPVSAEASDTCRLLGCYSTGRRLVIHCPITLARAQYDYTLEDRAHPAKIGKPGDCRQLNTGRNTS
ncbi:hypothetical protein E2C01_053428 [Portunus trituberculatus]|uniref:Uncharacterized protein n=1 Tax=Portunus trituberculatus TaxID=210409 RepID=A0A5B7GP63_PORTR|nr:hypothetical protein [Portunus trituberculatus]